jgi:phage gp37-like protein
LPGRVARAGGGFQSRASAYEGSGEANLNTRYTALSEIVVLKGDEAMRNPDARSAQAVLDRFTSPPSSEPKR